MSVSYCICTYLHSALNLYALSYIYIYIYTFVHVHVRVHVHTHARVCICIHVYTCALNPCALYSHVRDHMIMRIIKSRTTSTELQSGLYKNLYLYIKHKDSKRYVPI